MKSVAEENSSQQQARPSRQTKEDRDWRTYNNFTWAERIATIAPQKKAQAEFDPPELRVCSVTGERNSDGRRMICHLEDYRPDKVLRWLPCTYRVHMALHKRFNSPRVWYRIIYDNYRHGAWHTLLTLNPMSHFTPYDEIYPQGLPAYDELWPEMADRLGIHRELFNPDNAKLWGLWLPDAGIHKVG